MTAYVYNKKSAKVEKCRAHDPKSCKYHVNQPHWNSMDRACDYGEYMIEKEMVTKYKNSKLSKPGAKVYKIWDRDIEGWAIPSEEEVFKTKKEAQSSIVDVINETVDDECDQLGDDSPTVVKKLMKQCARRFEVKQVSAAEYCDPSTGNDYDYDIEEGIGDF